MTAVEFLVQQILKHDKSFIEFYNAEIQQSLELEKQQLDQAEQDGYKQALITIVNKIANLDGEKFLQSKDIWNHPVIENRVGEVFDVAELLNQFVKQL
jgi:hypothetical protein